MTRAWCRAAVLLLLASCGATGLAAQDQVDQFADMDIMTGGSGAVVGLLHRGELDFLQAWGTIARDSEEALTPEHVFPFLDLTPVLIAVTARALGEAGVLDLDAPVGSYVPGVSPALADATVAQLLAHRAGLDDARPGAEFDWSTILTELPGRARMLEPDQIASVSRYSYPAVAAILVRVTGLELPELLSQAVLEPLGMERSTFDRERAVTLGMPTGYARDPATGQEHTIQAPSQVSGFPVLFTAATDVVQFAAAWASGAIRGVDHLVGGDAPAPGEPRFGDGVLLEDYRGVSRAQITNSMPGYGATLWIVPSSQSVLFGWRNSTASPGLTLAFVQGLVATELGLAEPEDDASDSAAAVAEEPVPTAAEWSGTYRNGDLRVELRAGPDGELTLFAGREDLQIRPDGRGSFRAFTAAGEPTTLVFEPVELGSRRILTLGGRVYVRESADG